MKFNPQARLSCPETHPHPCEKGAKCSSEKCCNGMPMDIYSTCCSSDTILCHRNPAIKCRANPIIANELMLGPPECQCAGSERALSYSSCLCQSYTNLFVGVTWSAWGPWTWGQDHQCSWGGDGNQTRTRSFNGAQPQPQCDSSTDTRICM